jgi:hypothetical protein
MQTARGGRLVAGDVADERDSAADLPATERPTYGQARWASTPAGAARGIS